MGVARFKPRSYTSEPDSFGKAAVIDWIVPADPTEQDRQWAARLQHTSAVVINRRLRDLHKTVKDYSDMTGIGYDRLTKVLRGEAVIRLEDVSQAERLLGGIVDGIREVLGQTSTTLESSRQDGAI
jgi:hypothetical protein